MRIKNIVAEACHICGKQTSLAAIEPHPTHPEMELHTFRCDDCGPVRTVSRRNGAPCGRGSMDERSSRDPRALSPRKKPFAREILRRRREEKKRGLVAKTWMVGNHRRSF
jgi:hypothetical protein